MQAADLKTMDGLPKLAREHAANFMHLLGCDRSGKTRSRRHIVPNHEIRVASCSTGAGTERLVFRAIQIAISEMSRNSADFAFKYVFACEISSYKRQWIQAFHKAVHGAGLADGDYDECKPCLFGDITKLKNGKGA